MLSSSKAEKIMRSLYLELLVADQQVSVQLMNSFRTVVQRVQSDVANAQACFDFI